MAEEQKAAPKPVLTMTISAMSDGSMQARGIPADKDVAMMLIANLTNLVLDYYLAAAAKGRMKDGVVQESEILIPDNPLIVPPGLKVS